MIGSSEQVGYGQKMKCHCHSVMPLVAKKTAVRKLRWSIKIFHAGKEN